MSFNQTFHEQLDFFRQKLNLPTERWDDITLAAHDRAFVVAGAQGADLLEDLRGAIDEAIQEGTGLDAFRTNFARIVAENGWTGWTGEGTPGGEAWRTTVIYQTNMAASYAAGRRKQLSDPEMLKILPYWQFHHNDSVIHPRPLHLNCDGLTLPPDHPFWNNTWPPVFDGEMAFGCQCWVSAVSKVDFLAAIAAGRGPADIPAGITIDESNVTAPGADWLKRLKEADEQALLKFARDKIDLLEAELAQAYAQFITEGLAYSIDNIVALISAGLLTVDAAKALARKLPGFTQDMLGKIDAAPLPNPLPQAGEGM